jgi:dTDP-4-amino-4,6-dideoxygalactose transaminase
VNYRLSDLHAALGLAQLDKLEPFIVRRNALADRYRTLLADLPVELPPAAPPGVRHGYHLFPIRVADRARVFAGLRDAGIGVQVHYVPIHHHPAYGDLGFRPGDLPHADAAYERLISIPMHPGLTDDDQDRVVAVLADLTT